MVVDFYPPINLVAYKKFLLYNIDMSIIKVEKISSTNDFIKENYAVLLEGDVVIAKSQSCGRGTHGRSFFSPKGGLYFSILLKPDKADNVGYVTQIVAVAVTDAIREIFHIKTDVKYVNDIIYKGKKAGGILCESDYLDGIYRYVVVGIGLNLSMPKGGYPEEIKSIATALMESCTTEQADSLCIKIRDLILKYYYEADIKSVLAQYQERLIEIDYK